MEQHTKFEKPRGVSGITVRDGLALVHLSGWQNDVPTKRIDVLARLAKHNLSIDFLKVTPSGMSFVAAEAKAEEIQAILSGLEGDVTIKKSCSVVLAHAVNIRDEEGLIASILKISIEEGFQIEHISDMHDRALLVLDGAAAKSLAKRLESTRFEVSHAN